MSQVTKTLAVLVALALLTGGIAIYAWQGVYEKDKRAAAKKSHDERLFAPEKHGERQADGGLPATAFVMLTIIFQGETTVLARHGKEWRLTSPVNARADHLVVDGVVSQLQQARFKQTLEENPDDVTLKKYGLDAPSFAVEAVAEVGEGNERRMVKLEGGSENTFDGSIYMRRNGEKQVFTAEGGVRYALAKTAFDLRDKQFLAVEEASLATISVKSRANNWTAERGADGLWAFTRPSREPVDPTQFSAMISGHSALRAQAFPALQPGLFDDPVLDATVTLKSNALVRFRFIKPAGDAGERVLALREDADGATVGEFNTGVVALDRNLMDLKDKAVIRFKRELISTITLRSDAGEVVLEKDASADGWRAVAPKAARARTFKVAALLWSLNSFKAAEWGEEKPKDWAKFGLDAKARSIVLAGAGGHELARFTIGREVAGKPGMVYVRGTKDQVAISDSARFSEFPWNISDIVDQPGVDGGADAGQ